MLLLRAGALVRFYVACGITMIRFFFFFNDSATTEIYTLSLHDALPIYDSPDGVTITWCQSIARGLSMIGMMRFTPEDRVRDRKSTRLNSSHDQISYAVFCLKKKTTIPSPPTHRLNCRHANSTPTPSPHP